MESRNNYTCVERAGIVCQASLFRKVQAVGRQPQSSLTGQAGSHQALLVQAYLPLTKNACQLLHSTAERVPASYLPGLWVVYISSLHPFANMTLHYVPQLLSLQLKDVVVEVLQPRGRIRRGNSICACLWR